MKSRRRLIVMMEKALLILAPRRENRHGPGFVVEPLSQGWNQALRTPHRSSWTNVVIVALAISPFPSLSCTFETIELFAVCMDQRSSRHRYGRIGRSCFSAVDLKFVPSLEWQQEVEL
jgi:hypothetical protein